MINIYSHLEALWALERVNASTMLSTEEKKVVVAELLASLPDDLLVPSAKLTLAIVRAKLNKGPSIKQDEEVIGQSNNRPRVAPTPVPNRDHTSKETHRPAQNKKPPNTRLDAHT